MRNEGLLERKTKSCVFLLSALILFLSAFPQAGAAEETTAPAPTKTEDHFTLYPHNPMYILYAYDRTLNRSDDRLQNGELKFQLSFKLPVGRVPFTKGILEFGYTQVSFWQTFNFDMSSPFRETNYAPEFMISFKDNGTFWGVTNSLTTVGFVHQSNGQGVPLSRSWNRLYADVVLKRGNLSLSIRPWYRFRESAKTGPLDPKDDDNPDIARYMGYGELTGAYRHNEFAVSLMARNNLRSGPNHGTIQLDISGPIHNKLRWYVQHFNGYGESLIDYNRYSNRTGAGVMLETWP